MHIVRLMESTSRATAASPSLSLHHQPAQASRPQAPPAGRLHWSPRLWAILIVLCGALFLDALDVSMVGVALPSIRTALGLTTSSLQGGVSGYCAGARR